MASFVTAVCSISCSPSVCQEVRKMDTSMRCPEVYGVLKSPGGLDYHGELLFLHCSHLARLMEDTVA